MSKTAKFGTAVVRLEARAHQEGDVRIVLGDGARGVLDAEDLADDQLVAGLAIFAHDALIVGVGDVFGEDIFDVAAVLGGVGGLVDAAHPLLLDRHRVDGRDLQLLLREEARRAARCAASAAPAPAAFSNCLRESSGTTANI